MSLAKEIREMSVKEFEKMFRNDDGSYGYYGEFNNEGDKVNFDIRVENGKLILERGSIYGFGWDWYYGSEFPGLFWARVVSWASRDFLNFLVEFFKRVGVSLVMFKEHLLEDVPGIIYHITGDNSMWDPLPGGFFDEIESYEAEYVETNCPDELDKFYDAIPSPYEDIYPRVVEELKDDVANAIMNAKDWEELFEILVLDRESDFFIRGTEIVRQVIWEHARKEGVEC